MVVLVREVAPLKLRTGSLINYSGSEESLILHLRRLPLFAPDVLIVVAFLLNRHAAGTCIMQSVHAGQRVKPMSVYLCSICERSERPIVRWTRVRTARAGHDRRILEQIVNSGFELYSVNRSRVCVRVCGRKGE